MVGILGGCASRWLVHCAAAPLYMACGRAVVVTLLKQYESRFLSVGPGAVRRQRAASGAGPLPARGPSRSPGSCCSGFTSRCAASVLHAARAALIAATGRRVARRRRPGGARRALRVPRPLDGLGRRGRSRCSWMRLGGGGGAPAAGATARLSSSSSASTSVSFSSSFCAQRSSARVRAAGCRAPCRSAFDDVAHRDVDLARGLLAVVAMSLRQRGRPRKGGRSPS